MRQDNNKWPVNFWRRGSTIYMTSQYVELICVLRQLVRENVRLTLLSSPLLEKQKLG